MIRRIDLRVDSAPVQPEQAVDYRTVVPRADTDVAGTLEVVRPIVEDVRHRGVEAIAEYSAKFDGVEQTDVAVPAEVVARSPAGPRPRRAGGPGGVDRAGCAAPARPSSRTTWSPRWCPAAPSPSEWCRSSGSGLYVPGGVAPLVSSVLMNVVPAQVAGVESIALSSTPQKDNDGLPHPTILAACALLGVDEVYAVGGAQAIAMFAYGAGPCRPVDMITGPGNIYTVSAKRLVKGTVGIDSEAGPTEIAVLADESADPAYVAADLISQAEHDPLAASVLVTPSETLADAVVAELETQVAATKHVRADPHRPDRAAVRDRPGRGPRAGAGRGRRLRRRAPRDHHRGRRRVGGAGPQRGRDLRRALRPGVPRRLRRRVQPRAPDRRAAPATPRDCRCAPSCKAVHVIDYSEQALRDVAGHVVTLAHAEDLPGHGAAIAVRVPGADG